MGGRVVWREGRTEDEEQGWEGQGMQPNWYIHLSPMIRGQGQGTDGKREHPVHMFIDSGDVTWSKERHDIREPESLDTRAREQQHGRQQAGGQLPHRQSPHKERTISLSCKDQKLAVQKGISEPLGQKVDCIKGAWTGEPCGLFGVLPADPPTESRPRPFSWSLHT